MGLTLSLVGQEYVRDFTPPPSPSYLLFGPPLLGPQLAVQEPVLPPALSQHLPLKCPNSQWGLLLGRGLRRRPHRICSGLRHLGWEFQEAGQAGSVKDGRWAHPGSTESICDWSYGATCRQRMAGVGP